MAQKYDRLATLDVEPVLDVIRAYWQTPALLPKSKKRDTAVWLGQEVKIDSLRLQTFAHCLPCCSNPACGRPAAFFALERHVDRHGAPLGERYHLNLYGRDEQGNEILFTHDHTEARGLGGADSIENTTAMCAPCNFNKGKLEHAQLRREREVQGLNPHSGSVVSTTPLDPDSRNSQKQLAVFEQQAWMRGMSVMAFRAWCEAQVALIPASKKPFILPGSRNQAQLLGLSLRAYHAYHHRVKAYHHRVAIALATGKPGPDLNQVEAAQKPWVERLDRAFREAGWPEKVVAAHLNVALDHWSLPPVPTVASPDLSAFATTKARRRRVR